MFGFDQRDKRLSLHGCGGINKRKGKTKRSTATKTPSAASVHGGCLVDGDGVVNGTIQVKIGAPNKNSGLAKASATVKGVGSTQISFAGAPLAQNGEVWYHSQ